MLDKIKIIKALQEKAKKEKLSKNFRKILNSLLEEIKKNS